MPAVPLPRRLARFWALVAVLAVVGLALSLLTAQLVTDLAGKQSWRVVATGTVRNPHDEALAPVTGDYGNFALNDPRSHRTVVPSEIALDDCCRVFRAAG